MFLFRNHSESLSNSIVESSQKLHFETDSRMTSLLTLTENNRHVWLLIDLKVKE